MGYCECLRGRRAPEKPNLSKFILFYGGNIETMEVSYGIGVTNRYALFYDENEDPMDVLKSSQVKEASVAPVKKTVEKDSKPDKTKTAEVKPKSAPAQVKKGPHNWGSVQDEIEGQMESTVVAAEEV